VLILVSWEASREREHNVLRFAHTQTDCPSLEPTVLSRYVMLTSLLPWKACNLSCDVKVAFDEVAIWVRPVKCPLHTGSGTMHGHASKNPLNSAESCRGHARERGLAVPACYADTPTFSGSQTAQR
jgi:hypothetical protein